MNVYLTLINGTVDSIVLVDDNVKLFEVRMYSTEPRSNVVVGMDYGLDLYHVNRTKEGTRRCLKFRHAFNIIEKNLMENYQIVFKGLFWGQPVSTNYLNDNWLGFNNTLVISAQGTMSAPLEDSIEKYKCPNTDMTELLRKARSYIVY